MSASAVPCAVWWRRVACMLACAALAGCDLTGAEALEKAAAQREADGKAIGSACRHAGRAIEDCYTLNPKGQRASIFAGWREMDEYMRENKLEAVAPILPAPGAKAEPSDKVSDDKTDKSAEKAETKTSRADKRPAVEPPHAAVTTGKVDLPPRPRIGHQEPP